MPDQSRPQPQPCCDLSPLRFYTPAEVVEILGAAAVSESALRTLARNNPHLCTRIGGGRRKMVFTAEQIHAVRALLFGTPATAAATDNGAQATPAADRAADSGPSPAPMEPPESASTEVRQAVQELRCL